ncbi:molybdopterin-synthase adenylyltransferase MoeB [Pseudomonas rubra]|uniref:Molybdopterin-synthase adenylyltransferase MoeB n=1 Tax=Pseudomonas rubra TaxID=2942627 RepID=A0ABT5PFF6_9PSED|nr:molybdopterin-synthase adenylyltransferase MoeB [Pseudomonas rubra]MDD1017049.1 molybdopterin-synthase adenylyltransferase MoeB [Pseudomonas rubra]MDD1037108.1 molybdopterin-synthase adenylyltransferase MoeB [Pseudomonas rubra]MDD1153769.1 molybdopterin-synthase adenylyltransferase MoeB [Pseudomonas rubra]
MAQRLADPAPSTTLEPGEMGLYSRHLLMPDIGMRGQQALKAASVLMVGAGGLGCPALLYLAAAGVGRIGIIDDDRIELSNLHRQVIFQVADRGRYKAEVAKERLQALNPFISIEAHIGRFDLDNAAALVADYDIVIDGTDNFTAKYLINDACCLGDKPLVYGAIIQFEGQVAVFNAQAADGRRSGNYRDLYAQPPEAALAPNCAEAGVLGVLPGIIGCFQANEAIKLITGIGQPLVDRLLMYDALAASTQEVGYSATVDNPLRDPLKPFELRALPMVCSAPSGKGEATVNATQLLEWLEKGVPVHLIDVREADERERLSIGGMHVPLGQLQQLGGQCLEEGRLVLYCQSGARSQKGLGMLGQGVRRAAVFSLEGGISSLLGSALYPSIMAKLSLCNCRGLTAGHELSQ